MALLHDPTSHDASQPTKPTFFDLFKFYPIFNQLCQYLPIREIINLTRTCRALSNLYQTLLPQQWNVDRSLLRFVQKPRGLRAQLAKCAGLISGGFAVQFFERVHWPDSTLDIFVEQGEKAQQLELYLREHEGYRLKGTTDSRSVFLRGILHVKPPSLI